MALLRGRLLRAAVAALCFVCFCIALAAAHSGRDGHTTSHVDSRLGARPASSCSWTVRDAGRRALCVASRSESFRHSRPFQAKSGHSWNLCGLSLPSSAYVFHDLMVRLAREGDTRNSGLCSSPKRRRR